MTDHSRTRQSRRSFRNSELKAVFDSDLFARPEQLLKRRTSVSDVALHWLFLIGWRRFGKRS